MNLCVCVCVCVCGGGCGCKYINIGCAVYLNKFSQIIFMQTSRRKISLNSVVLVSVRLIYVLRKALSNTEN